MSTASWGYIHRAELTDVWDYYTTPGGTRILVGIDSDGCVITVPLAFVEVSA